jgi:predicted transcriptional regulator/DNA-binding transcriptional ArsR family regulator
MFMTYVKTRCRKILHQPFPSFHRVKTHAKTEGPKMKTMKPQQTLTTTITDEKNRDFAEILNVFNEQCRKCAPVSPLQCVSRCTTWRLKNEFRRLQQTMENPTFMKDLMNVLKNDTRLYILQTIVKGHYTIEKLQKELKKTGHAHSQDTIAHEYLLPLQEVGLAAETQEQYHATAFGGKLTELIENPEEFATYLPARSECYEETILKALLTGPKTSEELNCVVSQKILSRILKRLKTANLIETPEERDYIFFFASKRDPAKETFGATERKVYDNLTENGISANKLSQKTNLSVRRVYKYLRRLKGKKLVFTRKTPKAYCLTEKGDRIAFIVNELHNLVEETQTFSQKFVKCNENS